MAVLQPKFLTNYCSDRSKIIDYLEKGSVIIALMEYFEDLDNSSPVEPLCYFTDGTWIWPSYYIYILKKHDDFRIDKGFYEYVASIKFIIKILDKKTLQNIENEFSKQLQKIKC